MSAKKNEARVRELVAFMEAHGITAAVRVAERGAASITKPAKAKARADLLDQAGAAVLARPYHDRYKWLTV